MSIKKLRAVDVATVAPWFHGDNVQETFMSKDQMSSQFERHSSGYQMTAGLAILVFRG